MRRDEALRLLAAHRDEFAARGADSLSLFGSVARDAAGSDSDVDILIDFTRSLDLFDLGLIQVRLEEILNERIDLVLTRVLRPQLRANILAEAIRAT